MKENTFEKELSYSFSITRKIFLAYQSPEDSYYGRKLKSWFGDFDQIVDPNDTPINFYANRSKVTACLRTSQLKESVLTVVLIGANTWRNYKVDWLIYTSLLYSEEKPASRVAGLLLPTHPNYYTKRYLPHIIPPRLYDNLGNKAAVLRRWSDNSENTMQLLQDLLLPHKTDDAILSRPLRHVNYSTPGWVE